MPGDQGKLMTDPEYWSLAGAKLENGELVIKNSRNTRQNWDQKNYARLNIPLQRPITVSAKMKGDRDECAVM
jgi:hypothetical protein